MKKKKGGGEFIDADFARSFYCVRSLLEIFYSVNMYFLFQTNIFFSNCEIVSFTNFPFVILSVLPLLNWGC